MQKNVQTLEAQLDSAEKKLSLSEHLSRPDIRDEEGLPVTDIREELDDEGNVICEWQISHLKTLLTSKSAGHAIPTAESTPQILQALRRAGVDDLPEQPQSKQVNTEPDISDHQAEEQAQDDGASSTPTAQDDGNGMPSSILVKPQSKSDNTNSHDDTGKVNDAKDNARSLSRKKSVSFAEGTKTEDSNISRKRQPHPLFAKARSPPAIATAETLYDVQQKSPSDQMTALLNAEANIIRNDSTINQDVGIASPVIPEDESPEDAALRRQMLQYNMEEVGAVVAEIDLDDDMSTPPYSEDEDEDDTSVEEEDEHGRSKNIILSDEYVKQMKALETRLNASMIENIGPTATSEHSRKEKSSGMIANPQADTIKSPKDSPTKAVRFAAELDIQEAPIQDDVTEAPSNPASTDRPASVNAFPSKKKVSRFKSARSGNIQPPHEDQPPQQPSLPMQKDIVERTVPRVSVAPQPKPPTEPPPEIQTRDVPTGPPDRPHADNIIERPFPSHSIDPPPEPDEFDPGLLQKQVTTEYHRQRNRMIHRQGGFLAREEEEAEVPVDEYGNEEGRKVSRFMAARLGKKGF